MADAELVLALLRQTLGALETIARRFAPVQSPEDFTSSDAGMEKLDAICMQLIAVGESVKNLHKVTEGELLPQYPEVEWKKVMGMRDVISHHYFDVDAELAYAVCAGSVPAMAALLRQMILDLSLSAQGPQAE